MNINSTDCPCTKSELSFFEPRLVQTVMRSAQWVDLYPLNNVSQGTTPIEFSVSTSHDDFLDLNDSMLFLRCKVVKTDGTNFPAGENTAPINNWMHSLFSDIQLSLGDKQIEGGVHLYPYRAYLSNLFLFSKEAKKAQLKTSGFVKDTAGSTGLLTVANKGFDERKTYCAESKTVDLCGPLWLDMFTQSKYLIGQIDVHIKLIRSKPEFYMMGEGQIIIESAVLYIRKVQIESSYLLEIEKQLSTQNALYPLQHCEMLTYTIATGSQSHQKEGLFRGHMPKMVFVGMVTNKAYNGTRATNPFNFEHFNANHVALYKDGSSIPFPALTPDFSKKLCSREFQVLLQNLELFNRNEEFDITLDDFIAGGYTLFAFNLTPDLSLTGVCQPYQEGNLRLELKFSEALTESINVIVMSIFDGKVEITKDRNVLIDYKG